MKNENPGAKCPWAAMATARLSLFALALFAIVLFACHKQEAKAPPAKPKMAETFMPPDNGLVTPRMAAAYARARAEMVEVNAHLLDSLGSSTPERKAVFSRALELACDKVSRNQGLRGAAEYQWIQEHATTPPQNRETLAQVGIIIP